MLNTTINFNYKQKSYKWTFEHNLDEFKLSIDAAFLNWSDRFDPPLDQDDFCKYVVSKDPVNLKCKIV